MEVANDCYRTGTFSRHHHPQWRRDSQAIRAFLRGQPFRFPADADLRSRSEPGFFLEHDPEKWEPVFRKDHAQTKDRAVTSRTLSRAGPPREVIRQHIDRD